MFNLSFKMNQTFSTFLWNPVPYNPLISFHRKCYCYLYAPPQSEAPECSCLHANFKGHIQSTIFGERTHFSVPHRYPFKTKAHSLLQDLDQSSMPPLSSLRHCPISGCQHQMISGMITERHNIAC